MNNPLFSKILLIASLLISGKSLAQDISIGPVQNIAYGFQNVYPVGEKSFFATHLDKGTGRKLNLTHYKDFQEDATSGNLTARDCGVMVINGKLFVFEPNKPKDIAKVTAQEYGDNCQPVGAPREVLNYALAPYDKDEAKVIQSENKKYFAVYYTITKYKKCKYAFKIYDNSFNAIREGVFDCPFEEGSYRIYEEILSDQGDLYFTVNEGEMFAFKNDQITGVYVWKLENNTLNQVKIDLDGKTIKEVKVVPNDDSTADCFGMCLAASGVDEAFIGDLDFSSDNFNISRNYELSPEFIAFEGKGYSYKITDIIQQKNGAKAFVMEQYVHTSGMTSSNGVPESYSYTTYFDIKIVMIDQNQDLVWAKRLGHYNQVGYSGSYQKSFVAHSSDSKFVLYLNLNKEKDGMEKPVTFTVSGDSKAVSNNCLGKITVDLKTGDVERELLCSAIDPEWGFNENESSWDEHNNGMLLVFEKGYTKFCFGLASF